MFYAKYEIEAMWPTIEINSQTEYFIPAYIRRFEFSTKDIDRACYINIEKNLKSTIEITFDKIVAFDGQVMDVNTVEHALECWIDWVFSDTKIEKIIATPKFVWQKAVLLKYCFEDGKSLEERLRFRLDKASWEMSKRMGF